MRNLLISIGVIFSILFAITSVSSSQDIINGCVNKAGLLRVLINGDSACRKGEIPISWNMVGPQGPQGPQGPPGPPGETDIILDKLEVIENKLDDLTKGRFTDLGNGTVRDNNSGLIWLKNATCFETRLNWDDAMAVSANLESGQCGLSDDSIAGNWRLPTEDEWRGFVMNNFIQPALCNAAGTGHWSEGDAFNNVITGGVYWSSSFEPAYPDSAWCTNIGVGEMTDGCRKNDAHYVWPVRDEL